MKLKFNIYEILEDNKVVQMLSKSNNKNEFIIVGEKEVEGKEYFNVIHLGNYTLELNNGLKLDKLGCLVAKNKVKLVGEEWYKESINFEIPSEYLTKELVDNIQRLNR